MNLVMRGILPDNIVTRNDDTLEEDWPYFDENDPIHSYNPLCVNGPLRKNGYVESLNASLGRELLDREIFDNMEHLQTRLEQWRREHNEERPHASCGNIPPSLYAGQNQPSTLIITKPVTHKLVLLWGDSPA